MHCQHGRSDRINGLAGSLAGLLLVGAAVAQDAPTPGQIIGQAEINANDVYVRSGDSLNHYTVCKLKAGDRVTVVSERGEWYEILPPEGTFSLVSGEYVDTGDGQKGIINGNNVRVRAGSLLNDNKYTVQRLMSKGDEVTILGKNPDGFLRIQPPPGATLWIHSSYAQLAGDIRPLTVIKSESESAAVGSAAGEPRDAAPQPVASPDLSAPSPGPRPAAAAPRPTALAEAQRRQLEDIDKAVQKEYEKPLTSRQLEPYVSRYREIARQTSDEFTQQYAQRRMEELGAAIEAAGSLEQWKKIDEIADAKRREYRMSRAAIPDAAPASPSIEAKGVLRISALYPPGSNPQRYRLVDPSSSGERTMAYVEVPPNSSIKADSFLGKYVGVRALERRVQTGGVNPIPIFIADDLILLEPPDSNSSAGVSP